MKVKEFLKKYHLTETKRFNREDFCDDMLQELWYMFENTSKALHPVARWEKILSDLKQKWDSVFNKSILSYEAGEKLWKYFFATKVIPTRDSVFGDWKQAKHDYRYQTDADFRRRYDNWKFHQEFEEREQKWYQSFFNDRLKILKKLLFRADYHKTILEIPLDEPLDTSIISSHYRTLSKRYHPDVGGNSEKFIQLKKSRDALIEYIKES